MSCIAGGWESGLQNTLSPGDKVLTWRYGQFSHLWVDMMERLGLEVQVEEAAWGSGVDEAKLAEILKADTEKKIKAVCVVHNETTTGEPCTMRFGSTAKVLLKCNLKYYRISECCTQTRIRLCAVSLMRQPLVIAASLAAVLQAHQNGCLPHVRRRGQLLIPF